MNPQRPNYTKLLLWLVIINVIAVAISHVFIQWIDVTEDYSFTLLLVFVAITSLLLILPTIKQYFTPFNKLLQQLSADSQTGNQTLNIKGNQIVEQICHSYNSLTRNHSKSANALTKATNDLSFTAAHLSDVTESTNENIQQQQQETDMVATAMNEMSTTVEEVARNATDAAAAAEQANKSANMGESIAQASKTSIDALVEDINKASDVISQLEQKSADITVVLEVIKGIAEQTNLLALNAAIEAARAGEQGRGFAVVADEVRSLATRTQTSAQEIDEMIKALQDGVHSSVAVMEIASTKGSESSDKVEDTFNALKDIHQSVNIINDMNAQIATAAEEQSVVANEINRNIVSISESADTTTQNAQDSLQASIKIATVSQELKLLVDQLGEGRDKSLDLSSAKAAHLNWKTRLRAFLDGTEALTRDEAVSHRHCNFGKWYYGEGLEHFGQLQGMIDVEKPHEEIHELIRVVIDLKNNGQTAEAEAAYNQVAAIS
ncbi:MAG: methyl-accepting chemotaxis protein, partial [Woeseiaceae bacterium]